MAIFLDNSKYLSEIPVWIQEGLIFYESGDYDKAIFYYDKVLRIYPENREAKAGKEEALKALENKEE